jgi:hypothetical protein
MPAQNPTTYPDAISLVNSYIYENYTNTLTPALVRGLILSILYYMSNNEPPSTGFVPITLSKIREDIDSMIINNGSNLITPTILNLLIDELITYYASQVSHSDGYTTTTIDDVYYLVNRYFVDNDVNLISASKVRAILQKIVDYITTLYATSGGHTRHISLAPLFSGGAATHNYVAYVNISHSTLRTVAHGGHVTFSDGKDIVFYDTDGTTPCIFDMSNYDPITGVLQGFVKISYLSYIEATVISINYGTGSDFSSFRNGVGGETWVEHEMVQHFDSLSSCSDSTSNANNGGLNNITSTGIQKVGIGAYNFNGFNSIVNVAPAASLSTIPATWSFWINTTDYSSTKRVLLWRQSSGGVSGVAIYVSGGVIIVECANAISSRATTTGAVNVTDGLWHEVVVSFTSNGIAVIYIDGVWDTSGTIIIPGGFTFAAEEFQIGGSSYLPSSQFYNALIDEVRLYNFSMGAGGPNDRVKANYFNINNPGNIGSPGFATYGSEF